MQLRSSLEAEQGRHGTRGVASSVAFYGRPVGGMGTVGCGEEMDACRHGGVDEKTKGWSLGAVGGRDAGGYQCVFCSSLWRRDGMRCMLTIHACVLAAINQACAPALP